MAVGEAAAAAGLKAAAAAAALAAANLSDFRVVDEKPQLAIIILKPATVGHVPKSFLVTIKHMRGVSQV